MHQISICEHITEEDKYADTQILLCVLWNFVNSKKNNYLLSCLTTIPMLLWC